MNMCLKGQSSLSRTWKSIGLSQPVAASVAEYAPHHSVQARGGSTSKYKIRIYCSKGHSICACKPWIHVYCRAKYGCSVAHNLNCCMWSNKAETQPGYGFLRLQRPLILGCCTTISAITISISTLESDLIREGRDLQLHKPSFQHASAALENVS